MKLNDDMSVTREDLENSSGILNHYGPDGGMDEDSPERQQPGGHSVEILNRGDEHPVTDTAVFSAPQRGPSSSDYLHREQQ